MSTRLVVALRRYNPGLGRANRPTLEPVYQGDTVHPRWNLIAPPSRPFRIATLEHGDVAGPPPPGSRLTTFTGHPITALDRDVHAQRLHETTGLLSKLLAQKLVTLRPPTPRQQLAESAS